MLSFSGNLLVYLAVEPCDMRKSFNDLYALAENTLKEDAKKTEASSPSPIIGATGSSFPIMTGPVSG